MAGIHNVCEKCDKNFLRLSLIETICPECKVNGAKSFSINLSRIGELLVEIPKLRNEVGNLLQLVKNQDQKVRYFADLFNLEKSYISRAFEAAQYGALQKLEVENCEKFKEQIEELSNYGENLLKLNELTCRLNAAEVEMAEFNLTVIEK